MARLLRCEGLIFLLEADLPERIWLKGADWLGAADSTAANHGQTPAIAPMESIPAVKDAGLFVFG